MDDYHAEWVHDEPAISAQLVERIRGALDNTTEGGLHWQGKVFSSSSSGSEETDFGADILGVLDIATFELTVRKGFLAQAKMVKPGRSLDLSRLKTQCKRMLALSPDSFVFLYKVDEREVRVVPALTVAQATVSPTELYDRSLKRFLIAHFECFIGDQGLASQRRRDLEGLRAARSARNLLYLRISDDSAQSTDKPGRQLRSAKNRARKRR